MIFLSSVSESPAGAWTSRTPESLKQNPTRLRREERCTVKSPSNIVLLLSECQLKCKGPQCQLQIDIVVQSAAEFLSLFEDELSPLCRGHGQR